MVEIGTTSDINKAKAILLDSQNMELTGVLAPLAALHSRTAVRVFIRPETSVGTYDLEVAVDYGDPREPLTTSETFRIAVRKEPPRKK